MRFLATFAVLLTLVGCANTRTMSKPASADAPAQVFALTTEQADKVMASAMAGEFPGEPVSKIVAPNAGYQVEIRFMFDAHKITAYMIPAKGTAPDGTVVDGYYYEVSSYGSMVLRGELRASALFKRLVSDAGRVGPSYPRVM